MTEKLAVKVENVNKSFKLPTESSSSLRTTLVNYFRGIKGYREQHVLKNISFDIEKGDFFGIVGRNGSGKSTLLKILSQIYIPEKGSVTIDGKMVSFIELGVGFNPELTGRENVYLNGALLGFSTKEIDGMYQDVVDFSELSDFMDRKLKNYSSGMQVRLAFSIAIHADSDILLLDEVLAVGDEAFQRKCNEYFYQLKKDKKTVILVTHDMGAVKKYCNKAVMIDKGEVVISGSPSEVANAYTLSNLTDQGSPTIIESDPNQSRQATDTDSHKEVKKYMSGCSQTIPRFEIISRSNQVLTSDNIMKCDFEYEVTEDIETGITISIIDEAAGMGYSVIDDGAIINEEYLPMKKGKGKYVISYELDLSTFNSHNFLILASIATTPDNSDTPFKPIAFIGEDRAYRFSVRDAKKDGGLLKQKGKWHSV